MTQFKQATTVAAPDVLVLCSTSGFFSGVSGGNSRLAGRWHLGQS